MPTSRCRQRYQREWRSVARASCDQRPGHVLALALGEPFGDRLRLVPERVGRCLASVAESADWLDDAKLWPVDAEQAVRPWRCTVTVAGDARASVHESATPSDCTGGRLRGIPLPAPA